MKGKCGKKCEINERKVEKGEFEEKDEGEMNLEEKRKEAEQEQRTQINETK